nr:AmmeMemoRadiSam system protein B [Coraliomargarita parva]
MRDSRPPAVAGMFYPEDTNQLREEVRDYMSATPVYEALGTPRALIVPHAGYPYSGPVAGTAFRLLAETGKEISRVVLLGPSHHLSFEGLAYSGFEAFRTPLGTVPVDSEAIDRIRSLPQVQLLEGAHFREHCLEVELPFLQMALQDFRIVPLVVGSATPEQVAEVIHLLWDAHSLVLVSTDLSHYLDYETAQALDAETCRRIKDLDFVHIGPADACGARALNGLLCEADKQGLTVHTLDLRNSGDTAGDRSRVVGYGAWSLD